MSTKKIILGAGPAGLFCAHELKQKGDPPIIIEKNNHPGGLAATHEIDGAGFEVGPHIFQDNDEYIFQIAKEYLGEDLEHKTWKVHQYIDGELLLFPNDLANMWRKLGSLKMLAFIRSYLTYRFLKPVDFKTFIYKKVGKELAHYNVINYTEKMWGVSVEELEYEWIKPRMDRISIWKIIRSSFQRNTRHFHYPVKGAGQLYELMAEQQNIHYREYPTSIVHQKQEIKSLQTNQGAYAVQQLFSSIPLGELLHLLSPQPPRLVREAAEALRYRSQLYVILSFDQAQPIDSQWIYFPEKEIPFCRVHFPANFSSALSAENRSLLVFEYFCFPEDPIWKQDDQEIIQQTYLSFQSLNIIPKGKLLKARILRKAKAYPLLDTQRRKNLGIIEKYLAGFNNLHCMGRHGLHTYDNQHEAARTGVDVARS